MSDLMYLMNRLVDKDGKILIPGIYDRVAKVTDEEKLLYEAIDFDTVHLSLSKSFNLLSFCN